MLALCLVYLMRTTLFVFVVALLFGYLLSPLVNIIDRFLPGRRTRTAALAIAYVIFLAALFVAVSEIGSRAVEEANSLAKSMPAKLAQFQKPNPSLPASVNAFKAQHRAKGRRSTLQEFRRYHRFPAERRRQNPQRGQQPHLPGDRPHSRLLLLEGWARRCGMHFLEMIDDERRRSTDRRPAGRCGPAAGPLHARDS